MDATEQGWVQDAQRGDAGAFDRLVRLHERRILQTVAGILGNGPDLYDAYQDTLVSAFTKLSSFRFESAFSTWLTRIAINRALNHKRKHRPEREQPLEYAANVTASETSASVRLESEELRRRTEQALDALSERERAVFVLKHRHGYKLREIGDMLGCAEGTIKNYLFRATRKLRVILEPAYSEIRAE